MPGDQAAAAPDDLAWMSAEDHRHAFMAFTAGLLGDYGRYLAGGDIDLYRDGATYRMAALWLDDAEYTGLLRDLAQALQAQAANAPGEGCRRRIFAWVLLPADKTAGT